VLAALAVVLLLTGCGGDQHPDRPAARPSAMDGTASPGTTTPGATTPGATASPVPSPGPTSPTAPAPGASASPSGAVVAADPRPTVPARPVRRLPPVPLAGEDGATRPAEVGALRIEVLDIAPAVSAGQGPGEVQGLDAVAVTVRWTNDGSSAVALTAVVVDMSYGAAVPASPVSGPPSRPVTGTVRPGGTATGVYVFAVPTDERRRVQLSVSSGPALPTAVFAGPVA
jgi:hypothetical protein